MLLLCTEASFKLGVSLESSLLRIFLRDSSLAVFPLRTKEVTLMFMSFCCIRMQSFRRMPSLKVLKEMCPMNDIPSVCILLTFAPNSMDFVS